jgi:hypothetical protein
MVAVTYGVARAAARRLSGSTTAGAAAKKGKGFFARALKAMMDARLKQAQRELALYRHLSVDETSGQGELPFGR